MKSFASLFLMLSLALATSAHATLTGEDLLNRCAASEKSMNGEKLGAEEMLDSMWCVGYLSGLLDGFGVGDYRIGEEKLACPSESGITRNQALGIITQYLREHPNDLQKSGRRSALLALAKAFPCK